MKPLKTIVIDDEKNAINALKIVIEEFAPALTFIGAANSAKEGMHLIDTLQPDVVFLDIQMPHMTGIELMENYGNNRDFDIIFLTAFNNFAHEAFKLNAFHYLLKPIHIPAFLDVVGKLTLQNENKEEEERQKILKASFNGKISIPSTDGIEFITIADIIRIEAAGSYVKVFTVNKKPLIFSKNLKAMEKLLYQHPFFRVHKSHLININFIQKYQSYKDGGTITMIDGSETDLSRTRKEDFVALYKL